MVPISTAQAVLDEQTMRSGVFMARYKDFSDEEEQPNNP